MILITVGTQLPFDRLIKAMDDLAADYPVPFFAQIGKGTYQPKNMEWVTNIDPSRFDELFSKATVIVSHAGIGTVLTAQRYKKPIVLVPRRAALSEHRNDHQLATVNQLDKRPGIYVAYSEADLAHLLRKDLTAPAAIEQMGPGRALLITRLKDFIAAA